MYGWWQHISFLGKYSRECRNSTVKKDLLKNPRRKWIFGTWNKMTWVHTQFVYIIFMAKKHSFVWKFWYCPLLLTLLPILRFVLDEKFQQNASKFAILYIYENPKLLFPFFISCYFIFVPNECRQILKRFAGTFRRAQTLKLGGVMPFF